jgi:hypothetical protein
MEYREVQDTLEQDPWQLAMGCGFGQSAKRQVLPCRNQAGRNHLDCRRSGARFASAIGTARAVILEKETHQECPISELIQRSGFERPGLNSNQRRQRTYSALAALSFR